MSHGHIEYEEKNFERRKKEKHSKGSEKTGASNSMVPDDQGETRCVRVRPEIRKKCCLVNLWIVES